MNNQDQEPSLQYPNERQLSPTEQVWQVINAKNHTANRQLIKQIAAELKISFLDCAAALAYLNANKPHTGIGSKKDNALTNTTCLSTGLQPGIKLVRYRLAIGNNHNVTPEQLKQVLVEESGVDVKNIANIRILDLYTLIDLPDEMPQEVFHHLREVEINGQELAIKRVKGRNKKRGGRKFRRGKPYEATTVSATQANNWPARRTK